MTATAYRLHVADLRLRFDHRSWQVASALVLAMTLAGCRDTAQPPSRAPATGADKPPVAANVAAAPTTAAAGAATEDTWDAVFIAGAQVGSVHTTTAKADEDPSGSLVKIVSDSQLAIARYGTVATMRVVTESVETADGAVRSFSQRTESGASPMVVDGRVEADRVLLTYRAAGNESTAQLPWTAQQGGFFAVEGSLRRAPMQPGETRTVTLLMPGLTGVQLATATLAAHDWETTKLLEGPQRLLKISQTVRAEGITLEGVCWTDAKGEIIKSQLPSLQNETYRTSRERAAASPDQQQFDLGLDTLVRVTTPLPRPHATTLVVYEAALTQANPAEVFSTCASQTVEPLDAQRARITVRAVRPGVPADVPAEKPPTDADRQSNNLVQSDDAQVRQLAGRVASEVTDPWQVCVALEKWVHDAIRKKNFSLGFATAADVAQSLEGDCTEHAVLLAALCRARAIPARVCVGLVYSSGDQGFAFHMWNEAWIADRWIPLDATLGLGGIGAAHLKLQHSDLSPEQGEAAVMSVLQVMNQLQLQIVDVQQ